MQLQNDITAKRHIYDRVYLIGIDGAGCFFKDADTPNIDRIFSGGAYSHTVLTAYPTISAQCWGTMLHGVSPQAHRFTNGLVGTHPVPADHPYASVFKLIRQNRPDAVLASISHWNPINTGIIESGLSVIMDTGDDDQVCRRVCEVIEKDDPTFLFVQFDSVDDAGHRYGYGTPDYLRQISYVDSLVGTIHSAAEKAGRLDNTLFLITADHGGSPDGHHGGNTPAEITVSFFAAGRSVLPGEFGYMEIRDTPSVIAFALGLEQPANWSGRLPDGLLADGISFERVPEVSPDGKKRFSDRPSQPVPTRKGQTLAELADTKSMLCYFPFDGDAEDATGRCTSSVQGKLYFTEGFYGSAATLDDCRIHCSAVDLGTDSFTFCTWIKIDRAEKDARWNIFSTMADRHDTGLSFAICGDMLLCDIGLSDQVIHYRSALPGNYAGNWFHFICSYDRRDNELCYYYDFTLETDWYSEIPVPPQLALNGKCVTVGSNTPITLDELMVFDHKLSDDEIDDLEKYFSPQQ